MSKVDFFLNISLFLKRLTNPPAINIVQKRYRLQLRMKKFSLIWADRLQIYRAAYVL